MSKRIKGELFCELSDQVMARAKQILKDRNIPAVPTHTDIDPIYEYQAEWPVEAIATYLADQAEHHYQIGIESEGGRM